MHEECGVAGVSLKEGTPSALSLYYALYSLQHRGQEAAGISVYDGNFHIQTFKGMGLVPEVFKESYIKKIKGNIGIGHVRYSTTGGSKIENCQPLIVHFRDQDIAIAHNGNLVNSKELKRKLEKYGNVFLSESDTEVIARLLVRNLLKYDFITAVKKLMKKIIGSYSLVILINNKLIAIRDPLGIKPLCFGKLKNGFIVASESVAIDILNGEYIRDVKPGEMLMFSEDSYTSHRLYNEKHYAHCVFEYIYFARPDSIINNRLVYDVRLKIGETLYKEHPIKTDIVSPVPDSGTTYAIGFSRISGIDYIEALIKNRYVGRTFIMPGQDMRETAVRLKLNTIKPNIKNKSILLIDDSIVRGTTSNRIINMIRKSGAKEIHVRIGSPPIISPCYLGIDMPTRSELVAAYKSIKGIEALINADSLEYISIKGLVDSIGIQEKDLCLGCLTGIYPVKICGEKCIGTLPVPNV